MIYLLTLSCIEKPPPMVIPAARHKFYRRVNTLKPLVSAAADGPDTLVRAVLHLWQQASYPHLAAERIPYGSSWLLSDTRVEDFAAWLVEQPFTDAAYWLATAYAMLVGDERRSERALFFTPPLLADRVIKRLVASGASLTQHHWHDPACGGAAFLVPIAQQMELALRSTQLLAKKRLSHIEAHLSGNDLDPTLLEVSRAFLRMALSDLIVAADREPEFRLLKGDGLTSTQIEALQPDVLACNPPYRKLKAAEVDKYRKLHGDIIEQQPNIYGLFINRTFQLAKQGGLVGLLTPTSFLSGRSFSKLRTKLLTDADTLYVDMLSDRTAMFISVEQETAITILRTRESRKTVDHRTQVSVLQQGGEYVDVGEYYLPNSGRPWTIPRAAQDADLLLMSMTRGLTLADCGYVARVGHLVAYRDDRRRFGSLDEAGPGNLILPLVWSKDIAVTGDLDHGRESRQARDKHFVEVGSLSDHGVFTKPTVLLQRLTSTEQRRRLVAAAVPDDWVRQFKGYVCENHVIALEPVRDDAIAPELLARLLNTEVADRLYRAISGASNVAVSELNELRLPSPTRFATHIAKGLDAETAARKAMLGP